MKSTYFILYFLLLLPSLLSSQNTPPVIANLGVDVDTLAQTVTLDYDLFDAEDTELEIWLRISADGGGYFLIEPENVSGDIGFPVSPGGAKTIVWNYGQDDLSGIGPDQELQLQLVADDKFEIDIQELVDQVDSNRLKQDMMWLEAIRHKSAGEAQLEATKDSIAARFLQHGLKLSSQTFSQGNYTGENIQGRLPGLVEEGKTWIVDAHYDSVSDSPGADDNASGTAGFLEISRILSQYHFRESVKCIGFDSEEDGLVGSINYVLAGIPEAEDIQGVLNLEMIGYYSDKPNTQSLPFGFDILFPAIADSVAADENRGNFIADVGNQNSADLVGLFKNSAQTYVPELRVLDLVAPGNGQIAPDLRRSDHAPFWDAGYRALMLTNTSEFRNDNYHEPSDLISTLNFAFMTQVVKATLATAAEGAVPIHAGAAKSEVFTLPGLVSSAEEPAVEQILAALGPIRPNPGHEVFQILYRLERPAEVKLSIFNTEGQVIQQYHPGLQPAGGHTWTWDATDVQGNRLSSGLYFVRLTLRDQNGNQAQLTERLMIAEAHKH